MARRVYMRADRLIISLPGYDAGPNLQDAFKAFDSEWDWTGTIVASGAMVDPAPAYQQAYQTQSSSPLVIPVSIPFAIRDYILLTNSYLDSSKIEAGLAISTTAYISGNTLVIPRASLQNGTYVRWSNFFAYKVFSV